MFDKLVLLYHLHGIHHWGKRFVSNRTLVFVLGFNNSTYTYNRLIDENQDGVPETLDHATDTRVSSMCYTAKNIIKIM